MVYRWAIKVLKLASFAVMVTAVSLFAMALLRAAFPSDVGTYIAIFLVHSLIISSLCWLVMPRLGEWTGNHPWAVRWTILVTALLGSAVAGTAVASLMLRYTLPFVSTVPFDVFFGVALETATPVTVIVGVITTLIVSGRERFEGSQAALQEQRLKRETAEKLAAEAKLASLTSRVQPHFLFNSLNSIAALIRQNPVEAEQTVQRLASLLRSSLDNTETVPLDEEIKLVGDYLEIQKTRFGERLTFQITVAPGTRAAIPPFSIQTLVENSLKHVAEQSPERLDLRVGASQLDGATVVSVSDNGPGFDARIMKAGHGLDNLRARLRAVYGDRAVLEFFREPERMTVRFKVPDERLSG